MDVLRRRHIRESGRCPVCDHDEETIMHALFDCKYTSLIWMHSEFMGLLMEAPSSTFGDRVTWIAGRLDREKM